MVADYFVGTNILCTLKVNSGQEQANKFRLDLGAS